MLLFLLILGVVALALFTSIKIAFLVFLGIVAAAIILIALAVGNFIELGRAAEEGNGPLDKVLFGGDE